MEKETRIRVENRAKEIFGSACTVDANDNVFSPSGMRYGYFVPENGRVLFCDCTPDNGDVIVGVMDL